MPEALISALEESPAAKAAFEKLAPSHRREILEYLNSLKRAETIEKNAKKLVTKLTIERKPKG